MDPLTPCPTLGYGQDVKEDPGGDPVRSSSRAFGAWAAAGGVGGMAGALAGGALTTGLSWRWVFLINVPIGAVLIVVAMMSLAGTRTGRLESLDLTGAVTGTAGLAALIYGVMQSADQGWASVLVVGPALAGLLLLVLGQTPAAVTFLVIARSAAALLPRTGVRPLVLAGSGCFLAGFGWLAQADPESGYVTSVLGPTCSSRSASG